MSHHKLGCYMQSVVTHTLTHTYIPFAMPKVEVTMEIRTDADPDTTAHKCVCIYMYVCIYEVTMEIRRDADPDTTAHKCVCVYIYIYKYICMYI